MKKNIIKFFGRSANEKKLRVYPFVTIFHHLFVIFTKEKKIQSQLHKLNVSIQFTVELAENKTPKLKINQEL